MNDHRDNRHSILFLRQGLLVRELKAKEEKSVWQPQVQILLELKKKLADLTSCGNKSENIPKGKKTKSGKQNSTGKGIVMRINDEGHLIQDFFNFLQVKWILKCNTHKMVCF